MKTTRFDAADHIRSHVDQVDLLNDALTSGNAAYISNALGVIARARGITAVARGAGVSREALYKALNDKGDPKLSTVIGVIKTLNMGLAAVQRDVPRSDLKRVDRHAIQPHEYRDAPELTADQLARAVVSVGGRPVAKAKKRA